MYGFIRGSHLLVRCPKWTPLSSRAFIGITAMFLLTSAVLQRRVRRPARNGMSLVGMRLQEPDPLRDAYCPSQARYVALSRHGNIITQKFSCHCKALRMARIDMDVYTTAP